MKIKENKKETFQGKKDNMRKLVVSDGQYDMRKFDPPRPCPVKPTLFLRGVEPKSSTMF